MALLLLALAGLLSGCGGDNDAPANGGDAGGNGGHTDTDGGDNEGMGIVEGVVHRQGEVDHSGVTVALDGTDRDTVTEDTGLYRFENTRAGTYTVTASLAGYTDETSSPFEVKAGKTTTVDPLTLTKTMGELVGTVLLEGQSDHSGTVITVEGTSHTAVTDNSGSWAITGVSSGQYRIEATHSAYQSGAESDITVLAGQVTVVPSIRLLALLAAGSSCSFASECLSGVCADEVCCSTACDGGCEICNGDLDGSGTTEPGEVADKGTCLPFPQGTDPEEACADLGSCVAACNGQGACRAGGGYGTAESCCASASGCASGFCVDGVCCNGSCDGTCQTCNGDVNGSGAIEAAERVGVGTCQFLMQGADPAGECADAGSCVAACNGQGACRAGRGVGATESCCASASECESGFCVDGVCCNTSCDGTCEICNGDVNGSGAVEPAERAGVGTCQSLRQGADPEGECADIGSCVAACNGQGACRVAQGGGEAESCIAQGEDCSATGENAQCASGYCADGICCDNACNGICEACDLTGSIGICAGYDYDTDPESECDDDIPSTGCVGICNGYGGSGDGICVQRHCPNGADCSALSEVICESGFCADGICCDNACDGECEACDGEHTATAAGTCGYNLQGQDPADECVSLGTCVASCDGAGACRINDGSGAIGSCIAQGEACSGAGEDAQCATGFCADGVCCNSTCSGPCEVCNLTDSTGSCTGHPAGTDPEDDCPEGEVCNGAGKCVIEDCTGQDDFTLCANITDPDYAYDICIDETCVSPGSCGDASCNVPRPSFLLADTGQLSCHDNSAETACSSFPCNADGTPDYCGQDAQYGWDTSHDKAERFARIDGGNDEYLVEDDVTGLMWQGCAAGQTGANCPGAAWLRTWDEALQYCDALIWGGYHDWRLPDHFEAGSLMDYGRTSPAIDTTAFPNSSASWLWTSSSYAPNQDVAWTVYFSFAGYVENVNKSSDSYNVRCVRLGPMIAGPLEPSTVSDDRVVLDNSTGLMWQGCAAGQTGTECQEQSALSVTWQSALGYCEALSWADLDDWRLPSIAELSTIVDTTTHGPAIDAVAFPATTSDSFWSSSSYLGIQGYSWLVDFTDGSVGNEEKTAGNAVRCVRAEPTPGS